MGVLATVEDTYQPATAMSVDGPGPMAPPLAKPPLAAVLVPRPPLRKIRNASSVGCSGSCR